MRPKQASSMKQLAITGMTFPNITESMISGLIFAELITSLEAISAKSVAVLSFKAAPKAPIGVRFAPMIKTAEISR